MGYRSDVRLITTKKGYDKLSKFVKKEVNNVLSDNLLENCDFKSVHHNEVFMGWNSIKWYEYCDFKEVDSLLNGLKYLNENNYSYHFSRMGENYDDYEENNNDVEGDEIDIYPSMIREFDDDYVKSELDKSDDYYRKLKEKNSDILQNEI